MRSKLLANHLSKAFASQLGESDFPRLKKWLENSGSGQEQAQLLKLLSGLPHLLDLFDQTFKQHEEKFASAGRELETNLKELTETNINLYSLNQTFQAMVNSLDQAFFLFSKDGSCLSVHSKNCENFLERMPLGLNVTDVLKVTPEKKSGFLDWCSMLFEETIEFEELARLGPSHFSHSQNRIVALDYKAVRNIQGLIEAIVVIATDKTDEIAANQKAKELHEFATLAVSILKGRGRFAQFVQKSQGFFADIRSCLNHEPFQAMDLTVVKRHLHTLKDATGTFGMLKMRDNIHQIESNISKHKGLVAAQSFLKTAVVQAQDLFDQILLENHELLGEAKLGAAATREIPVDHLENFAYLLKSARPSDLSALCENFVQDLLCEPLTSRFNPYDKVISDTAIATQKKVDPIKFSGEDPHLFPEAYQNLWESLNHLFRNLVDHGIESPEIRLKHKKPEAGQIFVHCEILEGKKSSDRTSEIKIEISDDGMGIDPQKIRERLRKNGDLLSDSLSDHEVIQRIFSAGFSTAAHVTEISGRGIGLDVVQSSVQEAGGSIKVQSVIGKGTTFQIVLPLIQNTNQRRQLNDHKVAV